MRRAPSRPGAAGCEHSSPSSVPPKLVASQERVNESQEGYLVPWLETWGSRWIRAAPPSSLLPPKSLWDLALQGSGASSPFGLHERGRGAEWEEESGLSQGGDLGWGVADTGKWVFALFFFFFPLK